MANELSFANLETDAGLAHILAGEVKAKLYDPTDLRAVLSRRQWQNGLGSETVKVTQYSRAHAFAAATTEIAGGAANSDIDSGNFAHTVSRRILKFTVSDLWRMCAPTGSLDLDLLAGIFVESTGLTVTDMACALFGSLSNNVGSTTGDMSLDFMYDGQFQLNLSRVPEGLTTILRPKAFNELQASIAAATGAVQWQPATNEMIAAKGPGFKGRLNGHDIWDSDSVNQDGGASYYENAMFGRGCFEYAEAPPAAVSDAHPPNVWRIDAGVVRIVHDYDAANAITAAIADYYPSVVEAEDARGVEIRTQIA
jgi:hypothetical protein